MKHWSSSKGIQGYRTRNHLCKNLLLKQTHLFSFLSWNWSIAGSFEMDRTLSFAGLVIWCLNMMIFYRMYKEITSNCKLYLHFRINTHDHIFWIKLTIFLNVVTHYHISDNENCRMSDWTGERNRWNERKGSILFWNLCQGKYEKGLFMWRFYAYLPT